MVTQRIACARLIASRNPNARNSTISFDRNFTHLLTEKLGAAGSSLALLPETDNGEDGSEQGDAASEHGKSVGGNFSTEVEDVDFHGGAATADLHPLPVGGDGGVLSTVDELGQGDVGVVAEDVDILEGGGTVLELDAEEVTDVRGRTAAELDGNGGGVIG